MKAKFDWDNNNKDIDGNIVKSDYIYLLAEIQTNNENEACDFIETLVDKLNEQIEYKAAVVSCPDFYNNLYSDTIVFEKDFGNITEQKIELMKLINKIKKTI